MEKTKLLLESAAENYMVAAENICKYIEDPKERKKQLDDLRELTMEHAKLSLQLESKGKAIIHVTEQLKQIKDLEVEKQYKMMLNRYTLMDIIYHMADFRRGIFIVLTAFPLELKNK